MLRPIQIHGMDVIAYQDLNHSQSHVVLETRNDEKIRYLMINQNIISYEEHINFINSIPDSNKNYFAIFDGKHYLGSINIHKNNNQTAEWGLYLNPNQIGSGKGVLLELIALDLFLLIYNHSEITGLVKVENQSAMSMHRRFGFSIVEENPLFVRMNIKRAVWKNQRLSILKLLKI